MALKQQGQKLPSLEPSYFHLIGGLEDAWKTFPQSGVKIKMVPQPSPVSDHIFKMLKYFYHISSMSDQLKTKICWIYIH